MNLRSAGRLSVVALAGLSVGPLSAALLTRSANARSVTVAETATPHDSEGDCIAPLQGNARDTLRFDRTETAHDLTRPDSSMGGQALRLIGEYLERCLGTRRELFLAQRSVASSDSQTFLLRRRPLGADSSGALRGPEARAYLIAIDLRKLVVLSVSEFR